MKRVVLSLLTAGALLAGASVAGTSSPTFSIRVNPSLITLVDGSSGTATITTKAENGFDSSITLSANFKNITFNPNSIPAPGSGSSTARGSVGRGIPPGIYIVTIRGAGGDITRSTSLNLNVNSK